MHSTHSESLSGGGSPRDLVSQWWKLQRLAPIQPSRRKDIGQEAEMCMSQNPCKPSDFQGYILCHENL